MEVLIHAYPWLKPLHVGLVGSSGALFMARGLGVLAGQRWPLQARARALSVAIDTLLLAAGVGLWLALQLNPARDAWLGTKLLLLLLYIVLGSFALKRGRTPAARALCFAAAVAVFLFLVGVARAHHPLGALRTLMT